MDPLGVEIMRSCLKGIADSRCDCRGIEGAIQRVSSRSTATAGHALITGKQRQWTRSLILLISAYRRIVVSGKRWRPSLEPVLG